MVGNDKLDNSGQLVISKKFLVMRYQQKYSIEYMNISRCS